jgi:ketosteroid isomerase-like protein
VRLRALLVRVAISGLLLGCRPASPPFTEPDMATVRGLFDSVVTDIRAANWEAWSARFAEDALFHPPNGPAISGRPAILAWGQSFPPIEVFSFDDVRVSGEGNLAFGTSSVAIKLQGLPADAQKQLVVFRRSAAGAWQIQTVSVTSDLPLPQPALRR